MQPRLFALALSLPALALAGWLAADRFGRDPGPDLAEGAALYQEHCAACHGAELQGQPDWRSPGPDGVLPAPPHDETGHTWHHDDRLLFDYVKLGGERTLAERGVEMKSGMPGFGDVLSDRQIRAILAHIKSTWPEQIRAMQAEPSAAAR